MSDDHSALGDNGPAAAGLQSSASRPHTRYFMLGILVWIGWIIATVIGELLPATSGPMEFVGSLGISDKLLHASAYCLIAFPPAVVFGQRWAAASAGFAVGLGVALEFAQLLVPGRSFEIGDMVANTIGVAVGVAAAAIMRTARKAG